MAAIIPHTTAKTRNRLPPERPLRETAPKISRAACPRHQRPCTCAMGHLYRFVEPVLLLMLKEKGRSYGYDLSADLSRYAFTDAEIEKAVLYRTLRRLEENGYVTSDWDTEEPGPARRVYSLTREGKQHLREWADVLTNVAAAMNRFVKQARL